MIKPSIKPPSDDDKDDDTEEESITEWESNNLIND